MRRWILGTWSLVLVVVLAGCSAVGGTGQPTGDAGRSPGPGLSESYADALPEVSQLIVGTLKLDGTDQAVTAQQAQELLPLWEAYRTLSTSQTAAPQETAALVTQIKQTMTAAQMTEIADMKLTTADLQTAFRGRNPQGQGQFSGTVTPGQGGFTQGDGGTRGNNGGGFGGGDFGGGGGFFFPGGGGGFARGGSSGGGALAPAQTANPEAFATLRAQRTGTSGEDTALVGFLIVYLQRTSGVTPAPATGLTPAANATSAPASATLAATSTPAAAATSAATSVPTVNEPPAATPTASASGG